MNALYPLVGTIAAIATPPGQGGVGIVRVSGPDSLAILQRLLSPDPESSCKSLPPRMLRHGLVYAPPAPGARPEPLDEVLAVFMPGPATFTGEDVGEIHCHGGQAVLTSVLEAACAAGARLAGRGEFTYRAFANGKLDLTQAEAVAEMIAAPARQGVRLAQAKLSGLMGRRVEELRAEVETLRARVALAVDFPEEEAECLRPEDFAAGLDAVRGGIRALLAGYERARHWQEGVSVILAGRVNVGKSSLLNALLGRERAIVSPLPGTTRDFIEESINLDGLLVRLSDTAGLRASHDPVEMAGVSRALELARQAEVILLVLDAAFEPRDSEREFMDANRDRIMLVRNKLDTLPSAEAAVAREEETWLGFPAVAVSAKTGDGLEKLGKRLRRRIMEQHKEQGEPQTGDLVPNLRQSRLLAAALAEADALAADMQAGMPCDLFGVRLDGMAAYLGEITGFAATDDILGRIFSQFCIGK